MTYDPYAPPHHHHHHPARPPRYGASSSTRFLNRHLIGPQLTYYHPGRRYYHDYESYAFRSRRSRRQLAALSKDGQFGFPPEEEPSDLDSITFYQLEDGDAVFPPLPGQTVAPPPSLGAPPPPPGSSYRVQRGSGPPAPPPGSPPVCSSEEDQEDASTVEDQAEYTEDYIYISQDQNYQNSGVYADAELATSQDDQERGAADSPPRPEMNYSYTQQVVKPLVICSSPSSSSSSPSSPSRVPATAHLPAATQTRSVAMAITAASPWLVNELGEPLCTMVAPPPYSYDPNGSDLPRDCRVLQYYFNLGIQWYHQSCWQQQAYPATSPEASYPYQHFGPYLNQEPPLHAGHHLYPETTRGPHQPPSYYPESTRAGDGQTDGHGGPAPSGEGSSSSTSPTPLGSASSALLYPDQTHPSPSLLHLPYEAPPPATYLPSPPPPPHLSHHSSYHACLPPSTHWGALQTGGHAQRVYCPAPNPSHVVGYITTPHHTAAHYIPPPI